MNYSSKGLKNVVVNILSNIWENLRVKEIYEANVKAHQKNSVKSRKYKFQTLNNDTIYLIR